MNEIKRMTGFVGRFSLGIAAIALVGCQNEAGNPAESAGNPDYALEAQKVKAGPEKSIDAGLAALDAKFGYPAVSAGVQAPAGESEALAKAAVTRVFSATGDCSKVSKFIFSISPGDQLFFRAQSLNVVGLGTSDPVAYLIQFDDPNFKQNGILPTVTQADFRILGWNDDVATGDLSAYIHKTFGASSSGYFMVMAIPFNNAHSTRKISLNIDFIKAGCPNCDYVIQNPIRTIGGLVYRSQGANDFRANRVNGDGDPRVYVLMKTLVSGMSNGNSNYLTKNSQVFPYEVSMANGEREGNMVLIDNEVSGIATFTHNQYTP